MSDNPFADLDEEFGDDGEDGQSTARERGPDEPETTADAEDIGQESVSEAESGPSTTERSEAGADHRTDGTTPRDESDDDDGPSSGPVGTQRTVDPTTTEAFEYSPEMQQAVYPRSETWDAFEDAMELDMERVFRDYGVRNMSKREIHDAMFEFVVDNADAIAHRALRARGIDTDESEH